MGKSQDQEFKKFRFGLKVSPNISWYDVKSQNLYNNNSKLKFAYGLVTEFYFTPNYALATGFELLSSGGKLDYPKGSSYYMNDGSKFYLTTRSYNINYLQLPAVLKMKTNEIGYFTYFGQFGLNTMFKTSALGDDIGIYKNSNDVNNKIDIGDEVNFINLGLNMALGCEYNLYKETSLVTSLAFNKGFTNCLKKQSESIEDFNKNKVSQQVYSYFVSLNIGILF